MIKKGFQRLFKRNPSRDESSSDTLRIGSHDVPLTRVMPAIDSAPFLKTGKWDVLVERLASNGYLAFSSFFPSALTEAAAAKVRALAPGKGGFEVNLSTGCSGRDDVPTNKQEAWQEAGASEELQGIGRDVLLQSTLVELLKHTDNLIAPDTIDFQLRWVRGKGMISRI